MPFEKSFIPHRNILKENKMVNVVNLSSIITQMISIVL